MRMATCHPQKKHASRGLCVNCYMKEPAQRERIRAYERSSPYRKIYGKAYKAMIYKRNRLFVDSLKLERGCIDCGYKENPHALEFDHVRGEKHARVSSMLGNSKLEKIKEEIAKCEVRCGNCHNIQTYERQYGTAKLG